MAGSEDDSELERHNDPSDKKNTLVLEGLSPGNGEAAPEVEGMFLGLPVWYQQHIFWAS